MVQGRAGAKGRAASRGEGGPFEGLALASDVALIVTGRRRRKVVCVEMDGGMTTVPFYQSTGTGGYSVAGEWVPFYGIADLDGEGVPWLNHVWFVKGDTKLPPPGSPEDKASFMLERMEADNLLTVTKVFAMGDGYHPRDNATLGQIKETFEACADINTWLKRNGAMHGAGRKARGHPFIGEGFTGSPWKAWGGCLRFLRPMALSAGVRMNEMLGMTLKELADKAGIPLRNALNAWASENAANRR